MRMVKKEVAPPQKIRTVDYKAWQFPGFRIYQALTSTLIDKIQERLRVGVIEACHRPYQNP